MKTTRHSELCYQTRSLLNFNIFLSRKHMVFRLKSKLTRFLFTGGVYSNDWKYNKRFDVKSIQHLNLSLYVCSPYTETMTLSNSENPRTSCKGTMD